MGLRMLAMACRRITNAVCFICAQSGHGMVSYLDNFMGVSCPSEAWASFNFSAGIFQELGLEESSTKATPPSTRVTCFGVQFDTLAMNMSVTSERLWELEELLREWSVKKSASKRQLQSLIGKLDVICK